MKQSPKELLITFVISSVFLTSVIFLKIIGFVVLLALLGRVWGHVIQQILRTRHGVMTWMLGMYMVFTLMGLFSSMVVVWYSLYGAFIMIPLVLTIVSTYLLAYIWDKKRGDVFSFSHISLKKIFKEKSSVRILSALFVGLSGVSIFIMYISQSDEILWSPWQTMSSYVGVIYVVLMLLMATIIYFARNVKLVVLLCVLFSFVIHAYVPLAHVMPWGGDVWRHIAVEQKMIDGGFELPVLFGDQASYSDIGMGFSMPDIFITPHKYTYGHMWGSSIMATEIFGFDLSTINKWLVPIIWTLIMPIILFLLGRVLFRSPRRALWFLWLSNSVFSLQVTGAFTLPVSFGLPLFLVGLLLWFYYLKRGDTYIRNIVFVLTILMTFGYALYLVLMILVIGSSYLVRNTKQKYSRLVVAGASILFFPLIEVATYLSRVGQIDVIHNIKQMIGTMSGFFFAVMIRPHDIYIGNIFFNHTPQRAYIAHLFTSFRWHVPVMMIIVWGLFVFGLWYIFFKKKNKLWTVMGILSLSAVGGYIMSWTFLTGDHMFVRRLDGVIALCVIAVGYYVWSRWVVRKVRSRVFPVIAIICISWFGGTAYISGPDMRIVSTDEYAIAQTIFDEVEYGGDVCVLGDTWMLLALEGISSESIKAGNFPLEYQFAQTDRVRLYESLLKSEVDMDEIFEISGRDTCILVAPSESIVREEKIKIDEELGVVGILEYGFVRWNIGVPPKVDELY